MPAPTAHWVLACLLIVALALAEAVRRFVMARARSFSRTAWFALWAAGAFAGWCLLAPYDPERTRRGALVASTAVGGLLLLSSVLPGRLVECASRIPDLLFANAVAAAVLSELALRSLAILLPHSPWLARPHEGTEALIERNRWAPGLSYFGFPLNNLGEHDSEFEPKRPGQCAVASIGDSFSIGLVPHHFHFTTVAERELPGCEVYNMGLPGIGVSGYLYLLRQEALPLNPDLVVINFFVGNDYVGSSDPNGAAPAWLWSNRERLLLYSATRQAWRMHAEGLRIRGTLDCAPGSEVMTPDAAARLPWLTNPSLEPRMLSRERFLEIETEYARVVPGNAPDFAEGENSLTARTFRDLAEILRAASSTPVVVMIIPDVSQVDDALWAELQQRLLGLALDRDRGQRLLIAWLEEHRVPYLDLLPVLRAVAPLADGSRHLYHLDDTHFNARGNGVAGKALAAFLRPRLGR